MTRYLRHYSQESLDRHISLKEQSIIQIKQEKDLTELELKHLEETERLSQQGLKQIEQQLSLKKKEIELEALDNNALIKLNTEARDKTKECLTSIEESKSTLKSEIVELQKKNTEDEIKKEDKQQTTAIEKQFNLLKENKNKELDKLEESLLLKKNNLELSFALKV